MKIIKEGRSLNQVTCHQCDCVFEYEPYDVYQKDNDKWEGFYFVNCPHCGRHVIVSVKLPRLGGKRK